MIVAVAITVRRLTVSSNISVYVERSGSLLVISVCTVNPLNAELNPFCHLLTLLGAHHILHVSRIRVNDVALGSTQHSTQMSNKNVS